MSAMRGPESNPCHAEKEREGHGQLGGEVEWTVEAFMLEWFVASRIARPVWAIRKDDMILLRFVVRSNVGLPNVERKAL